MIQKISGSNGLVLKKIKQSICCMSVWLLSIVACTDRHAVQAPQSAVDYYLLNGSIRSGVEEWDNYVSSLAEFEEVAAPGDTLFIINGNAAVPLEGGITLKPWQKIIGLRADGKSADVTSAVSLTHSASDSEGAVIELSEHNEIAGLRVVSTGHYGIVGNNSTGAYFHDNIFTQARGGNTHNGITVWSLYLMFDGRDSSDVVLRNNLFRGGESLGGVMVSHSGKSSGRYQFEGNEFRDIVGQAISFEARDNGIINANIRGTTVKNIGVSGKHLEAQSEQNMSGGVMVWHEQKSQGIYSFENNTFNNLAGRAYFIGTSGKAHVETSILDSSADNVGVGNRNSDSILPFLSGSSTQKMHVRNYHFRNTDQVGRRSTNTALELFMIGPPYSDGEPCSRCKMELEIVDSVFEGSVSDGIQLVNWGSNSTMEVQIKNTKILRSLRDGIVLIAGGKTVAGNRSSLKVENTEVKSARHGLVIVDQGANHSLVDIGGGTLGSVGGNRIINSEIAEVLIRNDNPKSVNDWVGKNVFWGRDLPRILYTDKGGASKFQFSPVLDSLAQKNNK